MCTSHTRHPCLDVVDFSRQAKMELARSFYYNNDSTVSAFNPNPSDSDIPLHSYDREQDAGSEDSMHQRWDESGQAIGHTPDPRLHAPRARPSFRPSALYASPADAAAVTASRDPDDEWSNAQTPTTARPPEVAFVPVIAPPPNVSSEAGAYVSPSSLTGPSSFPQPPHSPGMPSPSSAMAPYGTYQPDHFAAPDTAREYYFQPAMGSAEPTSTEPPKLSPPPTYQ